MTHGVHNGEQAAEPRVGDVEALDVHHDGVAAACDGGARRAGVTSIHHVALKHLVRNGIYIYRGN